MNRDGTRTAALPCPARRRIGAWCWLLLAAGLMGGAVARGQASTSAGEFARANQLCEQGQYAAAIEIFEQLAASGQGSAALFYNLGNAHFHAGRPGHAVLAYRQAERLAPRDPDIRANLQAVRRAVSGREEVGPAGMEAVLGRLTLNEWGALAMAALWLWLGILAARQWRPAWQGPLRVHAWACGLALLLAGAGLAGAAYQQLGRRAAIVAQPDTQARLAPYDVSKPVWALPAGAEVWVVRQDQEWLEIRDLAGRAGWLKRDQVLLWPPP